MNGCLPKNSGPLCIQTMWYLWPRNFLVLNHPAIGGSILAMLAAVSAIQDGDQLGWVNMLGWVNSTMFGWT